MVIKRPANPNRYLQPPEEGREKVQGRRTRDSTDEKDGRRYRGGRETVQTRRTREGTRRMTREGTD